MSCNVSYLSNGSPLVREVNTFEHQPNAATVKLYQRYKDANRYAEQTRASGLLDPVRMPHNGVRLNQINAIPLPVLGGGRVAVVRFVCPIGHYGVINYVCNQFTGQFVEGSGDLVWSVGLQEYFYYGYGQINVTLGDLKSMWGTGGGGLWFRSQQVITYRVDNVNVADAGNVICALQGWFAPVK